MKSAWDLPRVRPRERSDPAAPHPGLVRVPEVVLDWEAALRGDDGFELTVLEDPETGGRYGEDVRFPGSALIAIDRPGIVPHDATLAAAFGEAARAARAASERWGAVAIDRFVASGRRLAERLRDDLPAARPDRPALDLAAAIDGAASEVFVADADGTWAPADGDAPWPRRSLPLALVEDTPATRERAAEVAAARRLRRDRLRSAVERLARSAAVAVAGEPPHRKLEESR